jgi:hypothetical protein
MSAAALALGAIAMPGVAVAGTPAQDQYTVNLPTPHGQKPTSGQTPVSHPNDLTPSQQQAASGPDKSQLTQIATSPQLGAPNTNGAGGAKGETSSEGSTHSSGQSSSGKGGSGSGKGGAGHQGEGAASALDLAGKSPAAPAAIVDAAGGAPGIGLLAALVAITVAAAVSFIVRRRRAAR